MPVQCLMKLIDTDGGFMVQVCWKYLPDSEHTLEPLSKVYKDVPGLFMKFLAHKNTSPSLVVKARRILHL